MKAYFGPGDDMVRPALLQANLVADIYPSSAEVSPLKTRHAISISPMPHEAPPPPPPPHAQTRPLMVEQSQLAPDNSALVRDAAISGRSGRCDSPMLKFTFTKHAQITPWLTCLNRRVRTPIPPPTPHHHPPPPPNLLRVSLLNYAFDIENMKLNCDTVRRVP